jgi:hypothetical protein
LIAQGRQVSMLVSAPFWQYTIDCECCLNTRLSGLSMSDRPITYKIITGSANPIANSATVALNSITSLGHPFVVVPPGLEKKAKKADDPSEIPGTVTGSISFIWLFYIVLAITLLSGIAEFIIAYVLHGPTTDFQKGVFSDMQFAWKAGIGAIFGLLGGKQTSKK